MSRAMEQALSALQLPIFQLAQWVDEEIETNPLLEPFYSSLASSSPLLEHIAAPLTRYEYLQKEIACTFQKKKGTRSGHLYCGLFRR